MERIDSRVNVLGLSRIVDRTDVASEIDIVALEKSIFSGKTQQTMDSASKKFEEDMMRINSLVSTQHGSLDPASPSRTYNPYGPASPPRTSAYAPQSPLRLGQPKASEPPRLQMLNNPYAPVQSAPAPQPSFSAPAYNPYAPMQSAPVQSSPLQSAPVQSSPLQSAPPQSFYSPPQQTQEERTKQALRGLLANGGPPQERMVLDPLIEDEDKAILVDDISGLRQMLKDSGIDVSSIEEPRMEMSKDTLLRIRHRLQIKNDRNRASTVADELIMLAAKGMETLFNGQREILGYKLDARGWSSSVRTKLRRMKYDTSVFIGEVMRDYSMSPKMRIAIEIVPSFILYVASRKKDDKPATTEQDWENASLTI
jgi:hypothetical protein